MSYLLSVALLIGLSAGLAPGPLLTLVLSESMRHGAAAGVRAAIAPLISDAPIILLAWWLLSRSDSGLVLGGVSLLGSVVVLFIAISSFRAGDIEVKAVKSESRSLFKGVVVNLLNPQPYLFWMGVGAPLLIQAVELSTWAAAVFLGVFYGLLIGIKVLLAMLVGHYRDRFNMAVYRWINRLLGVLLAVLSVSLFWQGLVLLGVQ